MKLAQSVFWVIIAIIFFSWIFGIIGMVIKTSIFPAFTVSSSVYLGGVFLLDAIGMALSCWLAVVLLAKTGQLKSVDPKSLAGTVTLVFAVLYFAFIVSQLVAYVVLLDIPGILSVWDNYWVIIIPDTIALIVAYFTLRFSLIRTAI